MFTANMLDLFFRSVKFRSVKPNPQFAARSGAMRPAQRLRELLA
jgi:hypothetical protein